MERTYKFIYFLTGLSILFLSVSCKKENKSLPELSTSVVSGITTNKAQCGGTIVSDGGSAITKRGVCWSTNQLPTIADNKTVDGVGIGSFSSSITGLSQNTSYYVRSYASNDAGTTYGNQVTFKTADASAVVTDYDGNVYNIVTIGTQVWMAENLRTTHYRDGSPIAKVIDNISWGTLKTGAYCNYKNDTTVSAIYGRLYNFYAVVDTRNLCPTGWHIPTTDEWKTLFTFLGGDTIAGKKLKEPETIHWKAPNLGATNESGFSALPGGFRDHAGSFNDLQYYGYWWTSSQFDSTYGWYQYLGYSYYYLGTNINGKEMAYSVRCVKD
ncbi:MAG: fibrobacter succinogenes major paralogous domain-containing protein [Bacteroidota bacterium]|nr:fibrobacter succinogenes major paralogous domain-containing protein [Bacteroidota bacterium]